MPRILSRKEQFASVANKGHSMKQMFYTISDVVGEASTTYYKVHYLIRSGKFK